MDNYTQLYKRNTAGRVPLALLLVAALWLAWQSERRGPARDPVRDDVLAPARQAAAPIRSVASLASRPRVPRAQLDPVQLVGAQLQPTLQALALAIVEALPLHPQKAAYDACVEAGRGERCASVIADVVDYAIFQSHALERIRRDEFGVHELVEQYGEPTVAVALGNVVGSSTDGFERTAALMLRTHALGEGALPPLPAKAYRELATRPIPEASLIAEEHRRVAVPEASADEFAQLARVPDARAQRSAVLALGHAETAEPLHQVVLGVSHSDRLWNDVAMAVSSCGIPCADTLQVVAQSGPPAARVALYEAMTFAPSAERAQLVAMAQQHAPSSMDAQERALQEEFLRTALSD